MRMPHRLLGAAVLTVASLFSNISVFPTHAAPARANLSGYRSAMWPIVQSTADLITEAPILHETEISNRTNRFIDESVNAEFNNGHPTQAKQLYNELEKAWVDVDVAAYSRDELSDQDQYNQQIQDAWSHENRAWSIIKGIGTAGSPAPGPRPAPQRRPTGKFYVQAWVSPSSMPYDAYPTLYAKSVRGARCSASVVYSTGRAPVSFSGYAKTVGASGVVSWSWHEQTKGASGTASVTCSLNRRSGRATATFQVRHPAASSPPPTPAATDCVPTEGDNDNDDHGKPPASWDYDGCPP